MSVVSSPSCGQDQLGFLKARGRLCQIQQEGAKPAMAIAQKLSITSK
jgi:hypothetical protein